MKKIIKLIKGSYARIDDCIFMKHPHQNEVMLNAFIKTHARQQDANMGAISTPSVMVPEVS